MLFAPGCVAHLGDDRIDAILIVKTIVEINGAEIKAERSPLSEQTDSSDRPATGLRFNGLANRFIETGNFGFQVILSTDRSRCKASPAQQPESVHQLIQLTQVQVDKGDPVFEFPPYRLETTVSDDPLVDATSHNPEPMLNDFATSKALRTPSSWNPYPQ